MLTLKFMWILKYKCRVRHKLTIILAIALICVALLIMWYKETFRKDCACACGSVSQNHGLRLPEWEKTLNFEGFDNETGTKDGRYIVPNYIHFIKFHFTTFTFTHMICIRAALKNQKPDKLFIHTDVENFKGKYWEILLNTPGFQEVLVINRMPLPTEIFGQKLNPEWVVFHGGDVARMIIMKKYGGIYLDNDSYIIRSLDDFRRYEMTLTWIPGKKMMNQVVLAHKDARFLHLWQESYRDNYSPKDWYWNAGGFPTLLLEKQPHLVHSVQTLLGTYDIRTQIYLKEWRGWRDYYSAHLMTRWIKTFKGVKYPKGFNEKHVLKYRNTFRLMVRDVYDLNDPE